MMKSEEALATKDKPDRCFGVDDQPGRFGSIGGRMSRESEQSQLAVLVDGRHGAQQGKLLQHPVLKAMELRFQETRVQEEPPKIDSRQLAALQESGLIDYQDPSCELSRTGKISLETGSLQSKKFVCQVTLDADSERASDLWVLVQQPTSFVEGPCNPVGYTTAARRLYRACSRSFPWSC